MSKNKWQQKVMDTRARFTVGVGTLQQFAAWMKNKKGLERHGFSPSSISNFIKGKGKNRSEERLKEFAKDFERYATEFFSSHRTANTSKINEDVFKNTLWYCYFFLDDPPASPKLGRALLKINKEGVVSITNIEEADYSDYAGTFRLNGKVIIFDLGGVDDSFKHVHSKANFRVKDGAPLKLMLGKYTSIEEYTVKSGTIVYELIEEDTEKIWDDMARPENRTKYAKALCFRDEEFKGTDISIKRFLRNKKLNHSRLPNAFDYDKLKRKMEHHIHRKSSRFIDTDKPLLYIATPCTSLGNPKYQQAPLTNIWKLKDAAINRWIDDWKDKEVRPKYYAAAPNQEIRKAKNNIEDTALFVLIAFQYVPSNCWIELGQAIVLAKEILIFCSPEVKSQLRADLDAKNIHSYEIEKEADIENALEAIKHKIDEHILELT